MLGHIQSMDVSGVLQEVADADSRAHSRFQVLIVYFIIADTSTSVGLPHLCQKYHGYCNVTGNERREWRRGGKVGSGSFIVGLG